MENAAERLLGLDLKAVNKLAFEIVMVRIEKNHRDFKNYRN